MHHSVWFRAAWLPSWHRNRHSGEQCEARVVTTHRGHQLTEHLHIDRARRRDVRLRRSGHSFPSGALARAGSALLASGQPSPRAASFWALGGYFWVNFGLRHVMICPSGQTKPSIDAMTRTPRSFTSVAFVIDVWLLHNVNALLLQWQQQYLTPTTLPLQSSTCESVSHVTA